MNRRTYISADSEKLDIYIGFQKRLIKMYVLLIKTIVIHIHDSYKRGLVWFDFCFTALQHILGHFGRGQLP